MSFFHRLFSSEVSAQDKARYSASEYELAQAKGELKNTVQVAQSNTKRLRLMEQTLALKEAYDGPTGR
jgi:DNA-binding transcriptional regulator YbjK